MTLLPLCKSRLHSSHLKTQLQIILISLKAHIIRNILPPISSTMPTMAPSSKHNNLSLEDRLKAMKKADLKSLLKQKDLPLSGNKEELIERLVLYPNGCPEAPLWQYSNTKKYLKRELLDPSSPIHNMSIKDIWNSDSRYKRYPLFPKYYEVLKRHVWRQRRSRCKRTT